MNKKVLFGVIGLVASNMFADNVVLTYNPYVAVKGGYSILSKKDNVKYKNGFNGGLEFGVAYDAWRLGLEVSYKQNKIKHTTNSHLGAGIADMKDGKYLSLAAMINAYYDYALTDECSLYLGLGFGADKASMKANTANAKEYSKVVFAWQVMAGVAYDINENWTVEAGYRLFNTAKAKFDGQHKVKAPFASSLELGVRYNF